jgi:hypothetical protein
MSFVEDVLTTAIELSPKIEKVRAIDCKPYHYALWCAIEDGKPFANEMCLRKWTDDGEKIVFMLESHNFYAVDPDEIIEVIALPEDRYANLRHDERDAETMKNRPPRKPKPVPARDLTEAQKDKLALLDFLEGPDPSTLPVHSMGGCTWCGKDGAGPGHDCIVWRAGRARIAAMKR